MSCEYVGFCLGLSWASLVSVDFGCSVRMASWRLCLVEHVVGGGF